MNAIRKLVSDLLGAPKSESAREGLVVTCLPTYDPNAWAVQNPPYRYMVYYSTEVRNSLDVPLRIVWFDGFSHIGSWWVANNIMRRPLTGKDFSAWYNDGGPIIDGVIPPGAAALNACNWHGSRHDPIVAAVKWAYKALDPAGLEYYAEVVIEQQLVLEVEVKRR